MERSIDPETGILRSERLIGVQQGAPKWVTKVGSSWKSLEIVVLMSSYIVFVAVSSPSSSICARGRIHRPIGNFGHKHVGKFESCSVHVRYLQSVTAHTIHAHAAIVQFMPRAYYLYTTAR